jgi:hypothetical protein
MRNNWLNWTPADQQFGETKGNGLTKPTESDQKLGETYGDGLTEPTELPIVSLGSARLGKYQDFQGTCSRPFPHCPHCGSFALYREHNIGAYRCQTCGLQQIAEDVARRPR